MKTSSLIRRLVVVALVAVGQFAAAQGAVAQTVVEYLHTDALGSPVAVTNQAGQVIERNDYEPYGAVIGNPGFSGVGFTGHVQDGGTGLTYMQQRYYDAQVGRFLSVDSVTAYESPGNKFNRYVYASNSPYNFKDPDGRDDDWFANVDPMGNPGFGNELGDDAFHYNGKALLSVSYGAYTVPALLRAMVAPFVKGSVKEVVVSAEKYPESAAHIRDAQAAGQPQVLTINRAESAANRREALQSTPRQSGKDRDEYPPAMFQEGGRGASVRHINPSDNRGAGACIGSQCRSLADGTRVRIRVKESKK